MSTKSRFWMVLCAIVFSPIILIGMTAYAVWAFLGVGWEWSKDLIDRLPTD
jgi:hypothetical protein